MHLLIRSESVQYLPLNNITGICVRQLSISSFGDSHVTTDSLFASKHTALFEHGGTLCCHTSPLRTMLYCDAFTAFILRPRHLGRCPTGSRQLRSLRVFLVFRPQAQLHNSLFCHNIILSSPTPPVPAAKPLSSQTQDTDA